MEKSNLGPKFKQIKEDIVSDILSSVYSVGDMIPKQEDYAQKYSVSRLTVRKAINDLVAKGILRTEKGRGTFVQEIVNNTYSYRRVAGFTSNVGSKRVKISSRILKISSIKADKRLSVKLEIPEDSEVILIERLRYANEICAAYQKSFIPKSLVEEIDFNLEDLEHNSLYEILRIKAGITIGLADEHFRAIRATKEIAGYFEVDEGDPVLFVNRVAYSVASGPIEYCEDYESSDINGIRVKSINI